MRTRRNAPDETILITEAPISLDDQQSSRRKKYAIMMSLRVVCLLVAAAIAQWSIVVALLLLVGGAVLPWCAVLIANDRPPKKAERVARYGGNSREHALPAAAPDAPPAPSGTPRVIEG
jgi:Flp pilus assembly protein TadB